MKIAIGIGGGAGPMGTDWEGSATFLREAEKLGVDSAWSAETWGFDAATPIAYMAALTRTIKLGTGIMQLGSRSPAMLAMTAMTLSSLSNGRFRLGLGASGPQVVEGWHGVRFANTLPRIRDAINIIRLVTSGEKVAYKGEYYELPLPGGEGKALRSSAPAMDIPIYLATLSPKALELTGELADLPPAYGRRTGDGRQPRRQLLPRSTPRRPKRPEVHEPVTGTTAQRLVLFVVPAEFGGPLAGH